MGKLDLQWNGDELIIKQCDKMKTAPHECDECEKRFVCFTERVKPNDKKVSSKLVTRLSDIMKEVDRIGNGD